MEAIIEGLAQYGPLGLWTASLLWMNWQQRKDAEADGAKSSRSTSLSPRQDRRETNRPGDNARESTG